jgi:stage IV sporulation protein FB
MFSSLPLGRLFGIRIFVHWSFWLLPLWVVVSTSGNPEAGSVGQNLGLLAAMFGCIVLHELGHALSARRFGIKTRDITLYPIGGVARLDRMTEKPWEELCIAIAGPLVNVGIALGLGSVLVAANFVVLALLEHFAGQFLFLLAALNLFLVLFNMIPAFPMDGGRVLRAILALPLGLLPATRIAVAISSSMAIGLAFYLVVAFLFRLVGTPIFGEPSPTLLFIAMFVFWAGQQELFGLEARARKRFTADERPFEAASSSVTAPVTVYLWDERKHEWVAQGVATEAPFRRRFHFGSEHGSI